MSSAKLSIKESTQWMQTPLDFSFKKLCSENDLKKQKPRKNRLGKIPEMGPNKKFLTSSVWLSNNSIPTTTEAAAILNELLEYSNKLHWLDLSFNEIYDIDKNLLEFKNLKIIYLHGNSIHNVSTISILKSLPQLRTLTLHGNPIDMIPQYRTHIIYMLPQLSNLDFSPILVSERKAVPPTGFFDMKTDKKPKPAVKNN